MDKPATPETSEASGATCTLDEEGNAITSALTKNQKKKLKKKQKKQAATGGEGDAEVRPVFRQPSDYSLRYVTTPCYYNAFLGEATGQSRSSYLTTIGSCCCDNMHDKLRYVEFEMLQ